MSKPRKPTAKPSKKATRAMRRLAAENRAPAVWYLSTDDPTISDVETRIAELEQARANILAFNQSAHHRLEALESHDKSARSCVEMINATIYNLIARINELEASNKRRGVKSLEDALAMAALDERVEALKKIVGSIDMRMYRVEWQMPKPSLYRRIWNRIVAWFDDVEKSAPDTFNRDHPMTMGNPKPVEKVVFPPTWGKVKPPTTTCTWTFS